MAYYLESNYSPKYSNVANFPSPRSLDGQGSLEDECCGWLWMKRKSLFSRWKYKYFSLKGEMLTYYDKFPAEEYFKQSLVNEEHTSMYLDGTCPQGVIRVAHVEESDSSKMAFMVYGTSGNVLDLRAAKSGIRDLWMQALAPAVKRRSRAWSGDCSSRRSSSPESLHFSSSRFSQVSIPMVKCGWMLRQTSFLKQWKRYYFVLQGNMLSYYLTSKPYDVPKRRGYVKSVRISNASRGGLLIALKSGAPLEVSTEDLLERDVWYAALQSCIGEERANFSYVA
jgi:hypothetical protein